jgi:hypothetical protein
MENITLGVLIDNNKKFLDFVERRKQAQRKYIRNKYQNNPEYKEKQKQYGRERYLAKKGILV